MSTPSMPKLQTHTILIVDDTPANLGILVDHLEKSGLRIVVAQDGEEGLERANFVHPDLVLLDVMMPGINGFEMCRRLKSNAVLKDIPVIFMTALSDPKDNAMGFEVGGADYITKPFQIAEVLARVNMHLELSLTKIRLASSEQRLSDFAELASDWFWEIDVEFRFNYVSSRFFDVTRILESDIIGKRFWDAASSGDVSRYPEKWRQQREDMENKRSFHGFEYAIDCPNGIAHVRMSGKPFYNDAGVFRGYRGTGASAAEVVNT
jgi:CheY-like chemotaxis protein